MLTLLTLYVCFLAYIHFKMQATNVTVQNPNIQTVPAATEAAGVPAQGTAHLASGPEEAAQAGRVDLRDDGGGIKGAAPLTP